jgi:hypothetical protein
MFAMALLAALGSSSMIAAASAQPPPVATAPAVVDGKAVAAEVRRLIAENYVLPEVRSKLDAALAKGLASGRYDVADGNELAKRLNEDMAAVAHDKHLGIRFSPGEAGMLKGRQGDDRTEGPAFDRMAQVRNHGLREMRVLEGNVRYLAVDGFAWTGPKSAEAYDTAMRFLKDADAVIIDLRQNGGGSPEAVQYLISHFVEPEKPLVTFYMGRDKVDKVASLVSLPAGRMTGKPLYVLTSGRSASAAEEFAGHVSGYKLGELIGETTAGAGFRNDLFPVASQFVLSVSVGRAVLASTNADWEGRGIAPTVAVAPDKALDVAQMRAVKKIAATVTSPYEKQAYEGLATMLAARLDPAKPALPLSAYAGRFGDGKITLENGRLVVAGPDGRPRTLLPLGQNLFAIDGEAMAKVEFQTVGGTVSSFDIIFPDGNRMKQARVQ